MEPFPSFRAADADHVERRIDDSRFRCEISDFGRMIAITIDTGTRRHAVRFWLENPKSLDYARSFAERSDFLDWFAAHGRDKLLTWAASYGDS
jgi:hypothetical protein